MIPFVPPDQLAGFATEMTKAGVDWQVVNYGGTVHSFTNPEAELIRAPGNQVQPADRPAFVAGDERFLQGDLWRLSRSLAAIKE
jgi:hypothetical protein